ncbi:MAG: choice-of-anchor L domain-containing protein [Flavobacteriales bacterium]
MRKILLNLSLVFVGLSTAQAQLVVDNTTMTPAQLVQNVLVGTGVTVSNITFNGVPANNITNQVGYFNSANANVGIPEGIILATGNAQGAIGPNNTGSMTLGGGNFGQGDPDLQQIANASINDAAVLEFDFIPQGDTIKFNYVFGSEEYPEFVGSGFNDAFGFFVSGPGITGPFTNNAVNLAQIPISGAPVTINNVNNGTANAGPCMNCAYYINNGTGGAPQNGMVTVVQYDGLTVVLEARIAVICGQTYHIKLAVGDAGDTSWDSGVFIEGGSFSSNFVDVNIVTLSGDSTMVRGCGEAFVDLTRNDNGQVQIVDVILSGSAGFGTDYYINGPGWNSLDSTATFLPGQDTITLHITTDPNIPTGNLPMSLTLSVYTVNACGDTILSSGTLWIVEESPIIVNAQDTILNCPAPTINISAGISGGTPGFYGYNISWNTGQTGTSTISVPGNVNGTYIVTVTDTCGAMTIDTINVILNIPPPPNVQINNVGDTLLICNGQLVNLTASGSGGAGAPFTYLWHTGQTSVGISLGTITTNTTAYVTAFDACGVASAADTVHIVIPPGPTVTINDVTVICPGTPTNLPPTITSGVPSYTYSWSPGGSTQQNPTFSPTVTTTYTVTVTDNCNQTNFATATITVPIYAEIESEISGLPFICLGQSGNYTLTTTGGAGQNTYGWSGSGSFFFPNNQTNTQYTPFETGMIQVITTDQCGNDDTTYFMVEVAPCEITIPNIFTPNGDGSNDMFVIDNLGFYPNTTLMVYNRWGDLVYESSNYQNNWNGTHYKSGAKLSDGTYFYIIDTGAPNMEPKSGHVTLQGSRN